MAPEIRPGPGKLGNERFRLFHAGGIDVGAGLCGRSLPARPPALRHGNSTIRRGRHRPLPPRISEPKINVELISLWVEAHQMKLTVRPQQDLTSRRLRRSLNTREHGLTIIHVARHTLRIDSDIPLRCRRSHS